MLFVGSGPGRLRHFVLDDDFVVAVDGPMHSTSMEVPLSFEAIYRQHYDRVVSLARGLGMRGQEAHDVAQDVFMALHQAMQEGCADPLAWLNTVTWRMVCRRRVTLRRQGFPAPIVGSEIEPVEQSMRDTDRRVAADDEWTLVYLLIDDLPPDLRMVFVLREIKEIPLEETATMLGLPRSTVSSQHKAARKKFDAALRRHRAKERRTTGAASWILLPLGPGTLVQFIRRLWQPGTLMVSHGGIAVAAAVVFTAGAATGVIVSNAVRPAPRPSVHTSAPTFAVAPVEQDRAPAALPTVLASASTISTDPAPMATASTATTPAAMDAHAAAVRRAEALLEAVEGERNCLETADIKLAPPSLDPAAALRVLEGCERRYPRPYFPEVYKRIRRDAQAELARSRRSP